MITESMRSVLYQIKNKGIRNRAYINGNTLKALRARGLVIMEGNNVKVSEQGAKEAQPDSIDLEIERWKM